MHELLLILTSFILSLSVCASILYYKRMREIQKERIEAKDIVSSTLTIFNRWSKVCEQRLNLLIYKVEALLLRGEGLTVKRQRQAELDEIKQDFKVLSKKVEDIERRLMKLEQVELKASVENEPINRRAISMEGSIARLTGTELMVLEILANEGERTVPEIKGRINLTREHTARLMKKLYEQGYLERDMRKVPYSYRINEGALKILRGFERGSKERPNAT